MYLFQLLYTFFMYLFRFLLSIFSGDNLIYTDTLVF